MTCSAFAPLTLARSHCQRFSVSIPGAMGGGKARTLPGREESPGDRGSGTAERSGERQGGDSGAFLLHLLRLNALRG